MSLAKTIATPSALVTKITRPVQGWEQHLLAAYASTATRVVPSRVKCVCAAIQGLGESGGRETERWRQKTLMAVKDAQLSQTGKHISYFITSPSLFAVFQIFR